MKKQLITIFFLVLSIFAGNIYAQTSKLSVQGVLRNSNGTAVENGYYKIKFKLWDQASGGTMIWNETRDSVRVEGGVYSIILGDAAKELDAPFDQPYFLGISIENGTELIPRSALTSSPYALSLIGDDNIFPNSGNVGVGASNPEYKLTVQKGNGVLGLNAEADAGSSIISSTSHGLKFKTTNAHIFTDEADTENLRIAANGNVGIGTDNPQNTLHVNGENEQIKIEGANNANIGFYKTTENSAQGASLGFDDTNGNNLILNNTIGQTHLKGSTIKLNPDGGNTQINSAALVNGALTLIKEGEGLKLKGTNASFLGLYPLGTDDRKGLLGFNLSGDNNLRVLNESSVGDVILSTNNGSVKVEDALHVTGWDQIHVNGNTRRLLANGEHSNYVNSNIKFNITATDHIRSKGFWIHSDQRIKKDISLSNQRSDLTLLNKIEITDYKYKDAFRHGTRNKKGVIAQQVHSIFPEAISYSKNFIPNIFAYPTSIHQKADQLFITMDKAHNLKVGDLIKCESDQSEFNIIVSAIIDHQTFAIDHSAKPINKEVFFFGTEVSDFHTVDYDQIFTLCVSAVQELSKKVEALEVKNARLKKDNAESLKINDTLKTAVSNLNSRMEALEGIFNATGSK